MAEKPGTGGRTLRPRLVDRSESPPKRKKRKTATPTKKDEEPLACIQSLPPELLEEILIRVSVSDVISFGATCYTFYELSLSPSLWRRLCQHQTIRAPQPSTGLPIDWRRAAILKCTQALHMYRLGGGPRYPLWGRSGGPSVSRAANPPLALGFKRVLPTREHLILGDDQGTIFILRNSVTSDRGHMTWRRAYRHSVLCHNAKDFAVDPRSDITFRQYIYVLVSPTNTEGEGMSGSGGTPGLVQAPPPCDCVEVYHQGTCQRVFRMTFHPSLRFTQLRLTGSEVNRSLLLLTSSGKVYSLSVNETQLSIPRSYTVQLSLKTMTTLLPHLPIAQVHASCSSCLYLTGEGSVYLEVHTSGVYRHLLGSQRCFDPHHLNIPLPLSLPYKVVKCSLGLSHLCLLDDCGRVFMQGSNRYGQLGTGDKIDRGQPTQVGLSMTPVEVFCGLNHSLALLEGESGEKEVHGCGCGGGGRLPGWSKGSAVFVRLSVRVPRAARSLCSSKDCLFLLCCHDVAEAPLFRCPPPRVKEEDEEEKERLRGQLAQMKECKSRHEQLDMLKEAVQSHMTLSSTHRHFLEEALGTIQHGSDRPMES